VQIAFGGQGAAAGRREAGTNAYVADGGISEEIAQLKASARRQSSPPVRHAGFARSPGRRRRADEYRLLVHRCGVGRGMASLRWP